MRMWKIEPHNLCRKHLLGEHVELHMMVGTLNKGVSIDGYLKNGLFEIHNIQTRHNDIVKEMENRGYNHNSPLPTFTEFVAGNIDSESNKTELFKRCEGCRKRYEKTKRTKAVMV